jgi:AcrR family transcriptional regulator
MSIPYEHTGRTNQKERTRRALIDAARALLADGVTPTVEDVATAAATSRATAYRYFPNQDALLVAAHPEADVTSLLGEHPPLDPESRLDLLVDRATEIFLGSEATYRTMLRLSLEPDPHDRGDLSLRKGLRLVWIEDALEPVRDQLSEDDFERLVHALAITIGIEAIVVLTDLGGLRREHAVEVVRWSARSLLHTALGAAGSRGDHDGR